MTEEDGKQRSEREDPGIYRRARPAPLAWSEVPTERVRPARQPNPRQPNPRQPNPGRPAVSAPRDWAPPQRPEPFDANPGQRRVAAPERRGPAPGAPRPGRAPNAPPPPAGPPARPTTRKRRFRLPIGRTILAVLLVLIIAAVASVFYFDSKLSRVNALASYPGRIGDTPGTNWLMVGSDSRNDLSAKQQAQLATGGDVGAGRTDTIMLLHIPKSGRPTLVSVPRDLYVAIPGQGSHKINAAFAFGGPNLLVQTLEEATHVHIDHYVEVGFGGFDNVVNSLGGLRMCLDYPINDPEAGITLKAGCQVLSGKNALGFVRTRATPNADLDRVVNQRKFLSALLKKATSAGTLINPFKLLGVANGGVKALQVDKGTHIWDLARLAWAMRGNPTTTTTPTGGPIETDDGDSLAWGDNTTQFFNLIAHDKQIPKDLLSTNTGATG